MCMYVCIYIYIYRYMYIYMYLSLYIYIYIHICLTIIHVSARFAMPVGVQTETEHYFGEGAEAPDEVAYETYEE